MSEQLQLRSGTAAQIATFVGALAEIAVDTTNNRLVAQDGITPGGWPTAKLAEVVPGWQNYTPTVAALSGSLTSYTINAAKYWKVGTKVDVVLDITITNAGSGANGISITPPTTPAITGNNGDCSGFESTVGFGLVGRVGTTFMFVYKYDGTFPGATNNRLVLRSTYISS